MTQKYLPSMKRPVASLIAIIGMALVVIYFGSNNINYTFPNHVMPLKDPVASTLEVKVGKHFGDLPSGNRPDNGRSKYNGTWWAIREPLEVYAYSAFYDDRNSLGTFPVIRIIVVAETVFDTKPLFCIVWYEGRKALREQMQKLDIGMGVQRHGKLLKEYIFACPLRDEDIPENVSILIEKQDNVSFVMPVEVSQKPKVKDGFIVCVSVTYWKQDVYRIVEWMELLNILGVTKVTIYNNSLEESASRIFKHYDQKGFVDFRQSHNFISDVGEETIHLHMSPVINDCMYRNMYSFKKVIVTDLDEIIVPRKGRTYAEMLTHIDKLQPSDHPAKNYIFRNDYFFFDIPRAEVVGESKRTVTLRYMRRLPPSPVGYSAKSIVDPKVCTNMHNHFCWGITNLYDTSGNTIHVEAFMAMNHHYKKCHFDVYEHEGKCAELFKDSVQDKIMLTFKKPLIENMTIALREIGLGAL